ncbi:MAG: alpha/beta hydrolase family protein [Betaproteobacteria bacterium]
MPTAMAGKTCFGGNATLLGSTTRTLLWAGLAAMTLASCAIPDIRSKEAEAAVERHQARGYLADRQHATVSARDTWKIGGDAVDVSLIAPAGTQTLPLVVYLPGLGESPESGSAWRESWAEAGYAVLAVQPASVGPAVWSSELARDGDFRKLAEREFSTASLAKRVALVRETLAEVERRSRGAAEGLYRRIDLSRIAVAGFDLGAQTAMIVAGEAIDGVDSPKWPVAVKAVIALSPYADFSGMGLERDFRSVRLPVLCVTSFEDTDPYGLITTAALRRAPFQYMPAGQKYLLLLSATPHALLSGRKMPPREAKADRSPDNGMNARGHGDDRAQGAGRRRGSDIESLAPRDASSMGGQSLIHWQLQLANVEGVTKAYLDATVKNDDVARQWLRDDAPRWLGKSGTLQFK